MATTSVSPPSASPLSPAKINIRLCGSVPRQDLESLSLSKCSAFGRQSEIQLPKTLTHTIEDKDCVASQLCHHLTSIRYQQENLSSTSNAPTFEAPSWAVPAQGESRLEPICDSVDRQISVDLTDRPVFTIGRSPHSDVQLLHATSSRRHAMMFHHSNGSCYLVDCGSAHGTYVNGIRITSQPNGGVVVPHRVRRGSIVRFGGPGAPSFMLKSFAFNLDEMKVYNASYIPFLYPSTNASVIVKHNTRLNALGKTAKDSLAISLTSKRSFDSMDTVDSEDYDCKRLRCLSPPLSPEQEPVRIVSPDLGLPLKRRRVTFSEEPPRAFYPSLVSPDLSSDENDDDA